MGHSIYLTIFLGFINFILIAFNFLIDGNEIFEKFISEIWVFSIIFLTLYIPGINFNWKMAFKYSNTCRYGTKNI